MAKVSLKQKEKSDESQSVEEWRRFLFRDEFERAGVSEIMADDIETLVHSSATWEEVRSLFEEGCQPDLVVKILK